MSRKKLILSILLMAVLVSAGIILPATHRHQTEPPQDKKRTLPQTNKSAEKPPVKTSSLTEIRYLGFEDLETFFPAAQIEELKEQLSSYLREADYVDISSVTFLVDETAYPSNGEVLLSFALSDGGKLPVTCQTASGTFTFGEGDLTVHSENAPYMRIYTRRTDDTLPTVTTEEIETMQEGGYADTESNADNHTAAISENPIENNTEEETP